MIHLAWTNLRYRLLRTIVAVMSITVGIWLAMTLRGVSEGTLRKSLEEVRSLDRYMMVRSPGPIFRLSQGVMDFNEASIAKLRGIDGVEAIIPFRFFFQQLTPKIVGVVAALPMSSFEEATDLFPVVNGSNIDAPGQVLVEKNFATNMGIDLGQEVTLTGFGSFKVQGYIHSRTQIATVHMLVDLDTAGKSLNDKRIQGIFVRIAAPGEMQSVRQEIKEAFPKLEADPLQLVADTLGKALNRFDQFINLIFWLSITVAALICGLVLLSMVGEQRRDLGILKAMGAADSAVMALILSQAIILGLSGATTGALLAYLMKITLLPQFFPSLSMELTLQWFLEAILSGVGAGLLGALGATAYALRVDPVEVLTYE